ncbi:MAG: putative metalloprotease CJM1_0395 family protein [Arcobacteraceae bacterium]
MEIVNNTFNYAYDYTLRANAQRQATSKEQGVQLDTRGLEKNESSNETKNKQEQENSTTKDSTQLSNEEKAQLAELKAADSRVKAHEAAHQSGPAASGGASYTYKKGPDGVMYAVGGEVPVRIETGSTPQESIMNLQGVIATALAPADPSPQDISIASKARVMMMKAQQELAAEIQEKMRNSSGYAQNAKNEYEKNSTTDSQEKNSAITA